MSKVKLATCYQHVKFWNNKNLIKSNTHFLLCELHGQKSLAPMEGNNRKNTIYYGSYVVE